MEKYLSKAINEFNTLKKSNKGRKYFKPYGKWNDEWNINKVIERAIILHKIDQLLNN